MRVSWILLTFLMVVVICAFPQVLVASILWGWFLTPIFSIQVPTFWMMYGLILFVNLVFKHKISSQASKSEYSFEEWCHIFGYAVSPFVILLIGFVVHTYLI